MLVLLMKKTTWVGIVTIATGIIEGIQSEDWSAAMDKILLGLALITGRDAIRKLEKP